MSSSISRSFARDEAPTPSSSSPFRNAFASSSTSANKPIHSPFRSRLGRPNSNSSYTRDSPSRSLEPIPRPPDAISTSSSTLVNVESTSDYRPWEVRSDSSYSARDSLDSAAISRGGRGEMPSISAFDEENLGTLPSIRISPLRRSVGRTSRAQAQPSGRASTDTSGARAKPSRQLCPDDCRCSDQDIDLGLCRRVVGSSSSGSESGSLSVRVHPTRPQDATAPSPMDMGGRDEVSRDQRDYSQHSSHSHSHSESRSQGRDFEKDPILVPRSARIKSNTNNPASTLQRSFDQLQRGLDTLDTNESDADSDADQQALAAQQRRAESMARWTARRSSLMQSRSSPAPKTDPPIQAPTVSPDVSLSKRISEPKLEEVQATPLRATPGRKSIAAVFESMQKEREARAAEEHKQWQEKQARRERERAARAFDLPSRRSTSASSSQFDSPVSACSAPNSPRKTRSDVSASPLLSTVGSPKVDEVVTEDVQPRHLGEEAAARIPETLSEMEEADAEEVGELLRQEFRDADADETEEEEETQQLTPQTNQAAFAFSSQPMALDLSPVRSVVSDYSSSASSPRKNAHRRQNTNNVSVAARTPPASLGLARQRLNHVLEEAQPQTPISGILSSAKKAAGFSSARRGHSVRFSPRPDYRSDSGSWDESKHEEDGEEEWEPREEAVGRFLLPAQTIRIPEVLAEASTPAPVAAGQQAEEGISDAEEGQLATPERTPSPAKAEKKEMVGLPTAHGGGNDSISQSVRFPGAYANTPVKKAYSRHTIKASPSDPRARILPFPSAAIGAFGLFPESPASDIPRESTPPPTPMSRAVLPPDDPRNSPRSPRPSDLGVEQFAPFQAGSSDDSSGSIGETKANTSANAVEGDDSMQSTISKILKTMEASHGSKVRRAELGDALSAVSDRVRAVGAAPQQSLPRRPLEAMQVVEERDNEDRLKVEQLRGEVMQALAMLADRIVQMQANPAVADDSTTSVTAPPVKGRRGLPGWMLSLLIVAQCALIAYLMSLAERKAQRMRMYSPPLDYRHLYTQGTIEWSAVAQDIHLTPLLSIPGLTQLASKYPPLPSPSMLRLLRDAPGTTVVELYQAYVKLNGVAAFASQAAVYLLSQVVSCVVLLILAPVQVLWIVVQPNGF